MNFMRFLIVNLGCKVNAYESRSIATLMVNNQFEQGDINNFDIAIINTCTVTHVASQKSRQHIRKLRRLNKKAIIITMGCYSNNNPDIVLNECGADIVLGVNNRNKIIDCINKFIKTKKKIIEVNSIKYLRVEAKYENLPISKINENTRAYVKISDGCDNFCSYCIIPFTRGRTRSRNPKEIICEISSLINMGYKEIVLTGIDTSSYGKEFKNYNFASLLKEILSTFKDLYRLRISSIEISNIDNKFLSLLKKYKNISNHLHIPLQSGCDKTLKDMNRKYLTKQYYEKIKQIRKIRKDISITTDLIVGFPNESEEDFNKTLKFIKKVSFAEIHAFPFSKRKGSKAYDMVDINASIKKERMKKILHLSNELNNKYKNKFINKKLDVLFESNNIGLTSNYLKVKGNYPSNSIHTVKITHDNLL